MKIMRAMSLIMCIVVIVSIGGVYAVWKYATGGPAPKDVEIPVDMNTCAYAITYINDGVILDTVFVRDNSVAVSTENASSANAAETDMNNRNDGNKYEFSHWMNAGSTRVDSIPAGNTEDYVLYPSFVGVYTAMFVQQDGTVIKWDTYTKNNYNNILGLAQEAEEALIIPDDCTFDYWQVRTTNNGTTTTTELSKYKFADEVDVTIYPVYTFNGDVNLIPMDNNGDGITDEYHVGGYKNPNGQALVKIPDYVNGIPITAINADAFSSYEGVHSVVIPKTVTTVGGNVLATDWGWFDSGETVTIYFEGSYEEWIAKESTFTSDWDSGLGASSRIFFLNGTDKVDPSQGYMQANLKTGWNGKSISWNHVTTVSASIKNEYDNTCDCDDCNGAERPDRHYWTDVVIK